MKAINLIIISAMLLYSLPEKYFSQNKRCCISIECFQYGSDRIKRDNISLLGQRFYPLWQWLDGWRRRIFVKATRRQVVVALGR